MVESYRRTTTPPQIDWKVENRIYVPALQGGQRKWRLQDQTLLQENKTPRRLWARIYAQGSGVAAKFKATSTRRPLVTHNTHLPTCSMIVISMLLVCRIGKIDPSGFEECLQVAGGATVKQVARMPRLIEQILGA